MSRWVKFLTEVAGNNNSNLRKGQKMFNVLWELEPEIALEIRGTENDPFNNDSKIGDFLKEVFRRMSEGDSNERM